MTNSKAVTKRTKDITLKGTDGKVNASFSLTFEVSQDHKFTVAMSDITDIVKTGLKLELPQAVSLGTFQDFYDWLNDKFNLTLPDLKGVPIVTQFMTGAIKIMKFDVKTAGTEDKAQKYDIDVTITFKDAITIIGTLALTEVEFGVKYNTGGES